MVLKLKKTLEEWIPFYVDAIKNRLRRDLNLSDVFDVQATRDNIGLSGVNNHTHYHDDRYIPKIDKEVNTRKQEITNLTNSLNNKLATEHNERIAADGKEKNERVTSINSIQAALNKEITDLKKLYNDLKNRLDGNEFVKSKDNANNIALKYEQKDGESAKSLHAYVDGLEVPFGNSNIVTYSGWIQDGDEIPLPNGVKESDCEWFVTPAMRSVDDNDAIMCFTTTRTGYTDFINRPDNNYYSYQTNSFSTWSYKNFYPRGRVVINRTAQRGPRLAFYMLFVGIKNKGYSY